MTTVNPIGLHTTNTFTNVSAPITTDNAKPVVEGVTTPPADTVHFSQARFHQIGKNANDVINLTPGSLNLLAALLEAK